MPSPKLEPLVLADEERRVLQGWARRRKTAQALALRARIVLTCAAEDSRSARWPCSAWGSPGARRRGSGGRGSWRTGWRGGATSCGPAARRTVTDEQVEKMITATLEQQPPGGTRTGRPGRWPGRRGMSQSTVSRVWRAFGLKPLIVQSWKLSTDPMFIDKVRDVKWPVHEPAGQRAGPVRGREVSQIQALDRTAPCLPMLTATPATQDATTSATAPPACSPPLTWPAGR